MMRRRFPRGRFLARALAALAAVLCALALGACGNTLQDQPIPHNALESLLLAPYPVYWLGGSFHGLQITEASHDPSGVVHRPVRRLPGRRPEHVRAAAEGHHLARQQLRARRRLRRPRAARIVRGVGGHLAERGEAIAIPTGRGRPRHLRPHPALARAAAAHGRADQLPRRARRAAAPRRCPNTGFGDTPAALPGAQPADVARLARSVRLREPGSAARAQAAARRSSCA